MSLKPVGTNPELPLVGITPWCWCRRAGKKSKGLCDFFFFFLHIYSQSCFHLPALLLQVKMPPLRMRMKSVSAHLYLPDSGSCCFGPRNTEVVVGMGGDHIFLVAGCGCCHVRGVPGQLHSPWRERLQLCSSWCTQSAPGCFQQVQGGHPSQILAGCGLTAHLLLGFCNRLHE